MRLLIVFIFCLSLTKAFSQTDTTQTFSFSKDTVAMEVVLATTMKLEQARLITSIVTNGATKQITEVQFWVFRKKKWELVPGGETYVMWYKKR